ncbi:CHAT domain-containing protein [Xylariaceae sp. AK1471]|nr:CHAT domain-containing protein [Xylariaceae sp. AK1471]
MNEFNTEIVQRAIRRYRGNGHFKEGIKFIDGLPQELKSRKDIGLEVAQLFLVQGNYRRAVQACNDESSSIFECGQEADQIAALLRDPLTAAFELVRAYIEISRYSKLSTALKLAQLVGQVWEFCPTAAAAYQSSQTDDCVATSARANDQQQIKCAKDDEEITEYRSQQSKAFWKSSQRRIWQFNTFGPSEKKTQHAGRLREARFLIYFEADLYADEEQALKELYGIVNQLEDEKWSTEKALTLGQIAHFELKLPSRDLTMEVPISVTKARFLFQQLEHGYGEIDLDLECITTDRHMSASEKFAEKRKIAERYFNVDHLQNGIRCLAFVISPEMNVDIQFDGVAQAMELLQDKIEFAGGEILKQLSLIHAVAQASLRSSEYGFALKSLESYCANPPAQIGPKTHGYIMGLLSQAYATFGQVQKSLQFAEKSLEIAESSMSYVDQSDAAFAVGLRRLELSRKHVPGSPEALALNSSARAVLVAWADKDAEACYGNREADKCIQIAECEYDRLLWSEEAGPGDEQLWIDRAEKCIPDSLPALKRTGILQLKLRMLMRQQKYEQSLDLSEKYLNDLESAEGIHPVARGNAFLHSSLQAQLLAWNIFRSGQSVPATTFQAALRHLGASLRLSSKAVELYRCASGSEIIITATNQIWEQLKMYLHFVNDEARQSLLTAFLSELSQTEATIDGMRRSVLPVRGLESLMNKRLLVSKEACLKLYNVGVKVALRLDNPAEAWSWLQRGKARAFIDSLGVNFDLQSDRITELMCDPIAGALIQTEQAILEMLNDPSANYVIGARRLVDHRLKMAENHLLREITNHQQGLFDIDASEAISQGLELTGLIPEKVKFIDWFVPSLSDSKDDSIVLLVRQLNGVTHAVELTVSMSDVTDWVRTAFSFADLATPPLKRKGGNNFLKKMNGLVEPLTGLTSEDDLLILSPSGLLNRVPLHALFVEGKSLAERNLVIYTFSVATIRRCLRRMTSSTSAGPHDHSGFFEANTKYFAVYEEISNTMERDSIFSHVRTLAADIPGKVSLGPEVTKAHFQKECCGAHWVHYHGHASYGKNDVVTSSLVLSDGTDLFSSTNGSDQSHLGEDYLSVREIFELELPNGAVHFTVIACDSGTHDMAPGDEPLGIIPALLHAGASSVLGCLWPIDSECGRAFSAAFYAELRGGQSIVGLPGGVLHLAQALRRTTIKMLRGELGSHFKLAHHWASFSLHGSWFTLVPS